MMIILLEILLYKNLQLFIIAVIGYLTTGFFLAKCFLGLNYNYYRTLNGLVESDSLHYCCFNIKQTY